MKLIILSSQIFFMCFLAKAQNIPWITRYQNEIDTFIAINDTMRDKSCDVLFLGSSSIVKWDSISKDLAPLKIIRRSYGGSTIRDIIYNYDIVAKGYHPQKIVIYVENDLSNSAEDITVEEIYDKFQEFTKMIQYDYPNIPLFIMSFKPSPSRLIELKNQLMINNLLSDYAKETPFVNFIDITTGMYDDNGKLRTDIWLEDQLHMNLKGYEIWTKAVRMILIE